MSRPLWVWVSSTDHTRRSHVEFEGVESPALINLYRELRTECYTCGYAARDGR
jgi:hypothetical protein